MSNLKGPPTSIPEYFSGQSIMMTGGTGFMGKVLLEKMLRCCPDIERIYLLIRPKRFGSIQKRWEEIVALPVFDRVRETNPDSFSKVHIVKGDIAEGDLGLSEDDKQMLIENVTIVYHAAAMIQFTDNLYELLIKNTKATYILLTMAKRMTKLKLFLYVSTAFSNMNLHWDEAEERVIPATHDWRVILKILEREPKTLAGLKEMLMCNHPNAYTWTKSMAEQIVDEHKEFFPTVIVRPAILYATFKEPFQGWADILCGLTAISVPIGLGLMRVAYTDDESHVDYVPADTAINAVMVATWKKHLEPNRGETDVYTCAVAKQKPLKTLHLKQYGHQVVNEFPSKKIIWPMHFKFTTNETLYYLFFILLQVIPGVIIDLLLFLTGNKPMILNLTKKVANVQRMFKRFSAIPIGFPNERFLGLENYLSEKDKETFSMKLEGWTELGMMRLGMKGAVKYFLKEEASDAAFKRNRRRLFWLQIIDKCFICSFYVVFYSLIFRYVITIDTIRSIGYLVYKAFWNTSI